MTHDRYLMISSRLAFFSVLAALNVSVISFFVMWSMADAAAVNRAEEHGFDPRHTVLVRRARLTAEPPGPRRPRLPGMAQVPLAA